MNTEIYNVQTSIGKFRVEKTNTHLKVGGNRFCVEIRFTNETEAELQWLITKDGKCELEDKPIRGNNTVHLLNLSFTILKSYKNIKLITLLDNSKFDCIFADGSKTSIAINKYNYLFYGGTWYETKFNAVPIDLAQESLYNETKSLYTDPSMKQPFDFRNPLLKEELQPIYEKSNTWKDFANALHTKYNNTELCRKIAPWYSYAVIFLTKNRMLPEYWKIDITNITLVPFTRLLQGGKKTKKQYKISNNYIHLLSPSELYDKDI